MNSERDIAGYCTNLGYLYCRECAEILRDNWTMVHGGGIVYTDSHPHCEEPCDHCGRVLTKAGPHDQTR